MATLCDLETNSQVSPSLMVYFLPLQVVAVGVAVGVVATDEVSVLDLRSISICFSGSSVS